ncbi:hypothetical protein CRENPOLYSF1_1180002 [Crenothrix polyspora]|uniref:Uncharacterized protein n=1 Tax=Crenothrix polyspora TaxID=360316 RepID=A0A1R4H0T0_9GAMM|nr:hypothetical protein CRENPOLYSF1_1180002 [Crenothrix polyspora]
MKIKKRHFMTFFCKKNRSIFKNYDVHHTLGWYVNALFAHIKHEFFQHN